MMQSGIGHIGSQKPFNEKHEFPELKRFGKDPICTEAQCTVKMGIIIVPSLPGDRKLDLQGGLSVEEAMRQVLSFVRNRPILGYHVAFDAAIIDSHIEPVFGFRLPNTLVELADVYMRRCGRPDSGLEADLRLETIATRLGLPVPKGRHTALNDAVFTAALYVRLMHGQRKV